MEYNKIEEGLMDKILENFIYLANDNKEEKEEKEKNIDSYINDLILNEIEEKNIEIKKERINQLIDEIVRQYFLLD